MKVIPSVKVKDMQWLEQMTSIADKKRNGIYCSSGRINSYRMAFAKGEGGSVKEITWNRIEHHHNCCKSRVSWRHKIGCPRLNFN